MPCTQNTATHLTADKALLNVTCFSVFNTVGSVDQGWNFLKFPEGKLSSKPFKANIQQVSLKFLTQASVAF